MTAFQQVNTNARKKKNMLFHLKHIFKVSEKKYVSETKTKHPFSLSIKKSGKTRN